MKAAAVFSRLSGALAAAAVSCAAALAQDAPPQPNTPPDLRALNDVAAFEAALPGDPAQALALADQLLTRIDDPDLRLQFGRAALLNAAPARAITYLSPLLDRLDETDPRLTAALDLLARAHLALGDEAQSLDLQMRAFNSAKSRMGGQNRALLARLDALEPKIAKFKPDLVTALGQMRDEVIAGNLPSGKVRGAGDPTAVSVWFGTNRAATGSTDPSQHFGTEPGDLTVGRMLVTLPEDHLSGLIERPSGWSFTDHLDPQNHIVLAQIEQMTRDAFVTGCCGENDSLLFVHGANTSFHSGALRAAQLSYDLEFPGQMMYYSWPSTPSVFNYLSDAKTVAPSRPGFAEFLELATRSQGRLHIVAHGMGSAHLLSALEQFLRAQPDRQLGQIILAAPDLDPADFQTRFDHLAGRVAGVTLYTAKHDPSLALAKTISGTARLGDTASAAVQIAGLDRVDVSPLETAAQGRFYFGDTPQLLGDIAGLLRLGWSPEARCGLTQEGGNWRLRPTGCSVQQVRSAADLILSFGDDARAEAQRRLQTAPTEQRLFWQGVLNVIYMRPGG
ncbi:MAG: alpha/beta hydrolase [Sulfitobacter sp.]